MTETIQANRLMNEDSPYLRMHARNPVQWYPWGEEAFDAARAQDKPVFLSVGYSSCHWCHVIARESFENEAVARVLNAHFIAVKVDKEERPDIDAVYMDALMLTTGGGGWPMSILMTADGAPFYCATYLPPTSRGGMTGLTELLQNAARLWETRRETLLSDARALTDAVRAQTERDISPRTPDRALLRRAFDDFSSRYDAHFGGFSRAPKFPAAHNLLFLFAYHALTGEKRALAMACGTLDGMARGGIFDHIGGGFCRYSVDEQWLIPHFEKMLYDGALLLWAYAEGYRITQKPMYREVLQRTIDDALAHMQSGSGAFFASRNADSDGIEGAYYAFTKEELLSLLGHEDGERFCAYYGITDKGNFEGGSVPNRIGKGDETEGASMRALRQRVLAYREARRTLSRDEKILTSWNALMICGLLRAYEATQDRRCLDAALAADAFIWKNLSKDGRLLLRHIGGRAKENGVLADYAYTALAQLALHAQTGGQKHLERASALCDTMLSHFADPRGGLYLYADDAERLIARPKDIWDDAMPSGNACAARALCRLAAVTGEEKWKEAAQKQLAYVAGAADIAPQACGFALYAVCRALSENQPSAR